MPLHIVGFAGSFIRPSNARALVVLIAQRAAEAVGATVATYDLDDLQPSLGGALSVDDLDLLARVILASILTADVLVVGSPVIKGSYPGLFKHLFDLIDPAELASTPVLLSATGDGESHALMIEHQLRPLFGFFEARSLPTGVYAARGDFVDGVPAGLQLLARIDRAVGQIAAALPRRHKASAA